MAKLSDLTLIIPSYLRSDYAVRSLKYWSGKGVIVHLLDGTPEGIDPSRLVSLDNNVNYHHIPKDILKRLEIGTELVKTKYAVLLGDDEFFLPSALQTCINELEADTSLVSCMGRTLALHIDVGLTTGQPIYLKMKDYEVLDDDPIERMVYHMHTYVCSTIYAVTKAPVWKTAMLLLAEKNFSVHAIEELRFEAAICFMGKSKVIPTLMWIRSFEQPPIRSLEPPSSELIQFSTWWRTTKQEKDREDFLESMVRRLKAKSDLDPHQIYHGLCQAFDAYANQTAAKNFKGLRQRVHELRGAVIKRVGQTMPVWLKIQIRPLAIIALNPPSLPSFLQAGKNMAQSDCFVNIVELEEIDDLVINFHSRKLVFDRS